MNNPNPNPPLPGDRIEMTSKCEFYRNYIIRPVLATVRGIENPFMLIETDEIGSEEYFIWRWTVGQFMPFPSYVDEWAEELKIEV